MTDQNTKKHDDKNVGVSPIVAAVAGAVIGASVAVAGAVALSDEKNRDKVKQVLTNVKDQTVSYMDDMQKQAEVTKNQVEDKLTEGKEQVKKLTTPHKGA